MSASASRVGIVDWGIGGMGCYKLLAAMLPQLSIVYWSDAGVVPYGKLPPAALRKRVTSVVRALGRHGVTHVVLACNAASTVLDGMALDVPVTGVIEHGIATVPPSLTGTLGVIGGARIIRSDAYGRALRRPQLRVRSRIAQPLSAHIEAGTTESQRFRDDLTRILHPLRDVDALLLACTHYPAIVHDLARQLPRARILDPMDELVSQVVRRWQLCAAGGERRFLTTGDPGSMRASAARAFGVALPPCERVAL